MDSSEVCAVTKNAECQSLHPASFTDLEGEQEKLMNITVLQEIKADGTR